MEYIYYEKKKKFKACRFLCPIYIQYHSQNLIIIYAMSENGTRWNISNICLLILHSHLTRLPVLALIKHVLKYVRICVYQTCMPCIKLYIYIYIYTHRDGTTPRRGLGPPNFWNLHIWLLFFKLFQFSPSLI